MADQALGLLSPWLRSRRLRAVRPHLRGRVLDFGCGVGVLASLCRPDDYLGMDVDDVSLTLARQRYPEFHFVSEEPVHERFDTIAALAVIEHVADPVALLARFQDLLAPDGRIALTTPHPGFRWMHTLGARVGVFSAAASEEHQRFIDRAGMQALLADTRLMVVEYHRFLHGSNQLFILKQSG
jgi:2-polyprenyl-3-methyl-5-hydroxy-6-metoxy-1,4-benzoquinol methylase